MSKAALNALTAARCSFDGTFRLCRKILDVACKLMEAEAMAKVLGPEIIVNAVCPGFIEGSWLREGAGLLAGMHKLIDST